MTEAQAKLLADRASVDIETLMRRLLGWTVRGRPCERVDRELLAVGFVPVGTTWMHDGKPAPEVP